MPVHPFEPPRGRIERLTIDSRALRGNLLGDPAKRHVAVYLPEGYDEASGKLPLFVALAGFTGSGYKLLNWQIFGENLAQRIDRLIDERRIGPVVLALPDGFTSLGGNQYVNSPVFGNWEDFLLDEMLPALERDYNVLPGPAHRAAFGRSSGGYGALVQAMKHGDRWAAVACHSGDIDFDILYRRDLPRALDELARNGGEVGEFLERFRSSVKVRGGALYAMMLLAMCASYDPDPEAPGGVRLPVDPRTCRMIDERWARWLEHDPLRMVEREECRENLRAMRGLFIDCGSKDEYYLHYGARSLSRRLRDLDIDHHYEEFDDSHSGIDYRMDVSLPWLYERIV